MVPLFYYFEKMRENLDFAVWSLCFPLLGWHLFPLFAAVFLSSLLTDTDSSVYPPFQQQALPSVHPHLHFKAKHAALSTFHYSGFTSRNPLAVADAL